MFFQDGLAETWQTEMFSWAVDLKVQSSSIEKYQIFEMAKPYGSVQQYVTLNSCPVSFMCFSGPFSHLS